MPDPRQLPFLVQLLEDDDPRVREAVLDELVAWGLSLEGALEALPEPPDPEGIRSIERIVHDHARRKGIKGDETKELGVPLERRMLYRPGQLVRHRRYGYRGVVVSVDMVCQASREWYERNKTQPPREQPWYHVLVHGSPNATYAAQSSLLPDLTRRQVVHPSIERFFDRFENGMYLRNNRPWPIHGA